ncbi:MAG: class I SAM-dependent rRNA methyltransferase [Bacteroidales bacterium]|nr:class I SAM-dependent rRNA methyltransferase [Bacteroidales bacterium]
MSRVKITLKSGKEQSIKRYHPWIFSGAIKHIDGKPAEGDIVDVYSNKNEFLATGHYQIGSIAIRIVSFTQTAADYEFWKFKIQSAFLLRKELKLTNNPETNAYRLVHGEGDNMPGLIIDFYNGTAVMQMHSIGMYLLRHTFVDILREIYGKDLHAVFDKSESTLPFKAGINAKNEYLYGAKSSTEILEYGNRFLVDWENGQKTGFFLDQRENRKLLSKYSKNRDILNMFCFTGGFSVYGLHGEANLVHSVDSSEKAMDQTEKNIALNFKDLSRHKSITANAFQFLNSIHNQYDLIILDPPAFAKHHNVLNQALMGYKNLNAKAFEHIRPGGIVFTFSCSQVVSKEDFKKSIFVAAANSGRDIKIIHQLTQPADHPVNIYHPEGEYLKGLVLYVH